MRNPWADLKPGVHVHPDDKHFLDVYRFAGDYRIRLEVPPVPFAGTPETSKVLFLLANPGFKVCEDGSEPDITHCATSDVYREQYRKGLVFKTNYPLWYLNPELSFTGAYQWQYRIFRELIEATSLEAVASRVMVIQYHAYRSRQYKEQRHILPTQRYGFWLVDQAIKAGKIIVMARPRKAWLTNVPALQDYDFIDLANFRNPCLTRGNIKGWGEGETKAKFIIEHGEAELERRREQQWARILQAVTE